MAIPRSELCDSLYVIRDRALLVNLDKAKTPQDWLRVPGVKAAWKKSPAIRGKTVLADADGDGIYELYGEGGDAAPGHSMFWCRDADGTVRWQTPVPASTHDNNGVQCEDLDGNGTFEVVSVGNSLTFLDAATGKILSQRNIYDDFIEPRHQKGRLQKFRLDNPYRIGHCTDKNKWNVVIANGYAPNGKQGGSYYPTGGVQVMCYDAQGEIVWHYKHAGENYSGGGHEIRLHDLDGDGLEEVIHSSNGGLVCLNHDGEERWRLEGRGPTPQHSDWICIDDVNDDGNLEVVVQMNGAKGQFFVLDADTGKVIREVPVVPASEVQNFVTGKFRPNLKGRQLAITTINMSILRLLDLTTGEYLRFPIGAPEDPTLRVWNGLDMYNCAAHDANGDGVPEIFTYTTPKAGQLARKGRLELQPDTAQALTIGVAAYRGDGELLQYWNFYTPTETGIQWGVSQWEMRQFVNPVRRYDIDKNGIEEAYIETAPWIILVEIVDLESQKIK
ncbi:FG-GAP repeat domain-containing protein [Planctomicrobium sp. SH664]|uniref:FG-GAP repeat domain-containing protein n=1 Tax=Planctomicrobium sp. SH664 TaxID=3448125 RepID=UPI003F5C8AC5